MDQEKLYELLARRLSGEATAQELEDLNTYWQLHPEEMDLKQAFEDLWKVGSKEVTATDFERHRLKYKIDFEPELIPIRPSYPWVWYAAACILIISFASAWYYSSRIYNTSVIVTVSAEMGVKKRITLPDGTTVWLNSGTNLSFDEKMSDRPSREVQLVGEAFFDVVKDKAHPFIIHTNKISVKVLGTAFNVRAYANDQRTEATLIRGKIQLDVNGTSQRFILRPNEKFALAEHMGGQNKIGARRVVQTLSLQKVKPVEIAQKLYTEEVAWIENDLVFTNEPFATLSLRLERWFNVKIKIENEKVKQYRYTGKLKNESIEEALKAMSSVRPFKFKKNGDDIIIY
ncbi:FecR family protein [Desertivirga arenae]|uniref:FecR family protein n=1 Tax=Desertivirga arenae TaxID=2810309 RepID=UPI001A9646F0|nr:FecR domain-containing protein [Pedobacter sp. SYSU D00823]